MELISQAGRRIIMVLSHAMSSSCVRVPVVVVSRALLSYAYDELTRHTRSTATCRKRSLLIITSEHGNEPSGSTGNE
jgi:hypothetical protein